MWRKKLGKKLRGSGQFWLRAPPPLLGKGRRWKYSQKKILRPLRNLHLSPNHIKWSLIKNILNGVNGVGRRLPTHNYSHAREEAGAKSRSVVELRSVAKFWKCCPTPPTHPLKCSWYIHSRRVWHSEGLRKKLGKKLRGSGQFWLRAPPPLLGKGRRWKI